MKKLSLIRILKTKLFGANRLCPKETTLFESTKGFSIIELVLYMGLFSILLSISSQLFVSSVNNRLETESNAGVDQDSTYIFLHLGRTLSNSTTISTPVSYGTPSASLTVSDGTNTYSYSLSAGNLVRTFNGQTEQVNGYNTQVTAISFEKMRNSAGHDTIRVNTTIQSKVRTNAGFQSKNYQTTLGTR